MLGWLPSQVENEDWATLAELQERIIEEQAEGNFQQWQAGVRANW